MSSDGKINSLGEQYIGATATATISSANRLQSSLISASAAAVVGVVLLTGVA